MPKKLCQQCLLDLTFVYAFINKCHKSDQVLQSSQKSNDNTTELTDNYEIQVKVEEHDLLSESEYKTETIFVKEESILESNDIEKENHICNVCSKCKYYFII